MVSSLPEMISQLSHVRMRSGYELSNFAEIQWFSGFNSHGTVLANVTVTQVFDVCCFYRGRALRIKNLAATHRSLWHGSRPRPATGFFVTLRQWTLRPSKRTRDSLCKCYWRSDAGVGKGHPGLISASKELD